MVSKPFDPTMEEDTRFSKFSYSLVARVQQQENQKKRCEELALQMSQKTGNLRSLANILRLDFLNFYGKNPTKWISKANQLFSYYQNPSYQKTLRAYFLISKSSLIESLRRPFESFLPHER
jgi:hypothetical protein